MGRIYTASRIPSSGGFADPKDLSGLVGWYRADIGIILGAGGVATWADQSVTGANLLQAGTTLQPALVPLAVNGRPAVQSDGTNDRMVVSGGQLAGLVQPVDVFLVAKYSAPWVAFDTIVDGAATNSMQLFRNSDTSVTMFAASSLNFVVASVLSWHTYRLTFNGASSQGWQDGASMGSGAVGANNAAGLTIFDRGGGGSNVAASLAEVILYNRVLTVAQAANVQAYLKTRYATP